MTIPDREALTPTVSLPLTIQVTVPQAALPVPSKESRPQTNKTPPKEDARNPALVDLNSQLYARGLTRSGLKLEGLNSKAQDQVIKVISKLLSQRAVRTAVMYLL